MKDINKSHLVSLVILWAIVHFILAYNYGLRNLEDAVGYVKGADFLLEYGKLEDIHHTLYTVPIVFIATFRWLFHGQIVPYLIFQCIFSGISTLALYKASSKIFESQLAGFFSCLIFLFWWDNLHWNLTTMTESLACSFICYIIFYLTRYKASLMDFGLIIGLVSITFFTRPTGVIIMLGVVAFLLSYHWNRINDKSVLIVSIVTGILLIGYFIANLMFEHWDFSDQYAKGNIVTYMDATEGTSIYHESLRIRSESIRLVDPNEVPVMRVILFAFYNPIYFLKLAFWKIWYLIWSVRPYYSAGHNIYSFFWVSFIYVLFCVGLKNTQKKPVSIFALTVIFMNCALIGVSSVDWDNRFYIPMEPGIVVVAGGGAVSIFSFCKKKFKSFLV